MSGPAGCGSHPTVTRCTAAAQAAPPHANTCSGIFSDINLLHGPPGGGGRRGGWRILIEPELHFGNDVLIPDLAAWRWERMPKLPKTAAFEVAPDWICEIVSPSSG